MGLWYFPSTWSNQAGRARSREKAYIIREFEVMEKRPQCQTQMIMNAKATVAPVFGRAKAGQHRFIQIAAMSLVLTVPKTSMKIWRTGCPASELTVVSKFWMLHPDRASASYRRR